MSLFFLCNILASIILSFVCCDLQGSVEKMVDILLATKPGQDIRYATDMF